MSAANYGTGHDDQLPSGYGRCVLLDTYGTMPNNYDNNQPYTERKPFMESQPESIKWRYW